MTELLQVDHLSKRYPGFTLQDISFSVKPGRIMGLIGKNGAGKSTTLKSILNMVRPESGTVTMLGKDFYANEKECKQDIGVVFGGIDFYPLKKLSAITAVTRRFYKDWDQERYNDYLRQFSLDENKQFRSLSNGMKVKYLLALALSHHATLYLLDEPTSGLDPVSWNFATIPNENWKNEVGAALLAYAQGGQTDALWEDVRSAFVDGWKREYDATH